MLTLDEILERLRRGEEALAAHITSWHTLEAQPPVYGEMPAGLDARLVAALQAQGIRQLYRHQTTATRRALEGHHLVVVTPTASGKTLCYNLPVLHALLQDPAACALYLFPTKALAHDQLATIQELIAGCEAPLLAATYDGDTPRARRSPIRRTANILLSNPDMLHVGILPNHVQWQRFFSRLRYVVLDEIHTYRGVFGSHVANVLRRLKRLCRFYGSAPQFICCSATIANPLQLARLLTGEEPLLVAENGAPRGCRHFVLLNPPIIQEEWGLRRSALLEACDLANRLLAHDVQTIVFGGSRRAVEQLLLSLREDAQRMGRDPSTIRGYRAGYLPAERREIERGLREGHVRGVVATTALELGIDIGGLAACVMAGYPGTIASTWQQAGRAGRGRASSVAFLIASSSPLDQYIITHPHYILGHPPEHALINPDNLYLLLHHVQCAAYELPFDEGESFGGENIAEVLTFLEEEGVVRRGGGRWYWVGGDSPAQAVSLRTAEGGSVTIVREDASDAEQVIGQIDRATAPTWVHEGAIYMHEGQQYLVTSLDWEAGIATVEPVEVDYYTEASRSTRITITRISEEKALPHLALGRGEIHLTTKTTGYRRLRLGSGEHLGWGEINLPEQEMFTTACWMSIPDKVVEALRQEGWWVGEQGGSRGPNWPQQRDRARRRDGYTCRWCGAPERPDRQHDVHHLVPFREFGWLPGENENYVQANQLSNLITLCPNCHRLAEQQVAVQSTLASLARVLGHVAPLLLMCDAHDLGIHSDVKAPQTGLPTVFAYDRIPGGVGLAEEVYLLYAQLLDMAAELVRDCPCEWGCPSCLGAAAATNPRAKEQVLRLIAHFHCWW